MESQVINLKLVESLIQAIAALSPAEKNLVRSRLLHLPDSDSPKQSAIDILTSAPGQQLFQTPEEVDRDIRIEKDAWGS